MLVFSSIKRKFIKTFLINEKKNNFYKRIYNQKLNCSVMIFYGLILKLMNMFMKKVS